MLHADGTHSVEHHGYSSKHMQVNIVQSLTQIGKSFGARLDYNFESFP